MGARRHALYRFRMDAHALPEATARVFCRALRPAPSVSGGEGGGNVADAYGRDARTVRRSVPRRALAHWAAARAVAPAAGLCAGGGFVARRAEPTGADASRIFRRPE